MNVLIIGSGNFGSVLAARMGEKKCKITVIEKDGEKLRSIKDRIAQAVVADAADPDVLMKFAKNTELAIVSLAQPIETSILITHYLKQMGVKRIFAKAVSAAHAEILERVGADQVVFPERDEAQRLASQLAL